MDFKEDQLAIEAHVRVRCGWRDEAPYQKLNKRATQVGGGISQALISIGIEHSHQSAGNLVSFFFTPHFANNHEDAKGQNTQSFATFFRSMLENGVSLPPSAFEAWFVNGAMSDLDIEKIMSAALISAKRVASI